MLEAFVITLREGVEVALIVGLIYAYLNKTDRRALYRPVNLGLYSAVAASLVGAVAFQRFKVNQEAFEGAVMLVAALLVGSFMIWMHRKSKTIDKDIARKVAQLAAASSSAATPFLRKESLGLWAFTFVMVLREGIETVVFLSAVSLSTTGVFTVFGGVAGIALAVAFGILFAKGSVRINLRRFFAVTNVVLAVFLVQLLINGYHELAEQQVIPAGPTEMAIVGPIVRYNVLFIIAVLSIPVIMFFLSGTQQTMPASSSETSQAQRRKLVAQLRRERLWRRWANALALSILAFLSISFLYGRGTVKLTPAQSVQSVDGVVRIPTAYLDDGALDRFGYTTADGVEVRFLGIRTPTGEYRVALDACGICGDYGYYQDGNLVICINCDAPINISTIATGGGCNPMELPFRVQENEILIEEADLSAAAKEFSST